MKLTLENKEYINRSVLCWVASISPTGMPNVSPKEIFSYYDHDKIIIANIVSPQTVRNIKVKENVCVSFIDILVQKGFQIKGKAKIVNKADVRFSKMKEILTKMTEGNFPFTTITVISVNKVKPIIAPKYHLYPDTTEKEQIESAKKAYQLS